MSDVALLSPQSEDWRVFAERRATSPLQQPAWLDALTAGYRLHARIMVLADARGAIVAGLPMVRSKLPWRKRWTSLPFTDTLAPVATDDARRDELLTAAVGAAAPNQIVIRTHTEVTGWFSRQVGTVQTLELSGGADGVLRAAHRKTRQNVGRARKAGCTAQPITSRSEFLGESLALIAESRRRLGAPTQPRRYWSRLWELHGREEALTVGAYVDGRLAANGIFIIGSNHATLKYSASASATRTLRTNYLVLAAAIDHLAARGIRSLDLGITDIRNASLREYKVRWGGEELPAYFSATDARLLPSTLEPGPLLTKTIQRAPVFVGRTVGAVAYPFAA